MTFKQKVQDLLEEALAVRPDLFLIEFTVSEANKILVILDGDNGINLQDCIDVSRAIEHNIDKEEFDFGLDVMSSGVSRPLTMPRQFIKNIGRKVQIKANDNLEFEATLINATESEISLEWEAREPKKTGKGKETVQKSLILPYSDIIEAIIVISF